MNCFDVMEGLLLSSVIAVHRRGGHGEGWSGAVAGGSWWRVSLHWAGYVGRGECYDKVVNFIWRRPYIEMLIERGSYLYNWAFILLGLILRVSLCEKFDWCVEEEARGMLFLNVGVEVCCGDVCLRWKHVSEWWFDSWGRNAAFVSSVEIAYICCERKSPVRPVMVKFWNKSSICGASIRHRFKFRPLLLRRRSCDVNCFPRPQI